MGTWFGEESSACSCARVIRCDARLRWFRESGRPREARAFGRGESPRPREGARIRWLRARGNGGRDHSAWAKGSVSGRAFTREGAGCPQREIARLPSEPGSGCRVLLGADAGAHALVEGGRHMIRSTWPHDGSGLRVDRHGREATGVRARSNTGPRIRSRTSTSPARPSANVGRGTTCRTSSAAVMSGVSPAIAVVRSPEVSHLPEPAPDRRSYRARGG